jgi:hypothetical protein
MERFLAAVVAFAERDGSVGAVRDRSREFGRHGGAAVAADAA